MRNAFNRLWRFLAVASAVCSVSLVIGTPLAAAQAVTDPNDFTVTNFSADYYLSRAVPQGQMRVVERISVDFAGDNHGIYRTLPLFYHRLPLNIHINSITSASGAPATYTVSTSGTNELVRIGDPNQTVTGDQEYTLDYSLQNVVSFYKDHDELYWNVNGTQWQQIFVSVQATLHMPPGLTFSSQTPVCYAGPAGATAETSTPCQIAKTAEGVQVTALNLSGASTLTYVVGFTKGYFRPPVLQTYVTGYLPYALQLLIPMLLIGGSGFIWWLLRGRDAKGTGIIIPQYDAPNGFTPLEVGALIDFNVENRDITATLIRLAIRKYIRIIEQGHSLIGNKKSYAVQIINKQMNGLNDWEQQLLTTLFYANGPENVVSLSAPITAFQLAVTQVKKSVERSLTTAGYFVSNPYRYVGHAISIGALVIWFFAIANLLHLTFSLITVGIVLGIVTFMVFWHLMPARTAKGTAAKEQILGLKLYLEVAEKDRLAKLQSPSAPYADNTGEPMRTVDLFEKLLPYAITLKVEKEWAQQFADIYTSPPDWYAGNMQAFSVGYLAGSLGGDFGAATSLTARAPSSSSGFSGGGFAGGGGGGGGGGGW